MSIATAKAHPLDGVISLETAGKGIPVYVDSSVPRGQVWLLDGKGQVVKVVNLGEGGQEEGGNG